MLDISTAKIASYQFEVPIRRSVADLWSLATQEIDDWWAEDFRALGEDSTIVLDAKSGGQLVERTQDGSSLEWYRVQMVVPGESIHLVGYLAPDWGGPTTSMLKLGFEERDVGCSLVVSDSLVGNVTEASAKSAEDGWKTLFGEGLRVFSEK